MLTNSKKFLTSWILYLCFFVYADTRVDNFNGLCVSKDFRTFSWNISIKCVENLYLHVSLNFKDKQ